MSRAAYLQYGPGVKYLKWPQNPVFHLIPPGLGNTNCLGPYGHL